MVASGGWRTSAEAEPPPKSFPPRGLINCIACRATKASGRMTFEQNVEHGLVQPIRNRNDGRCRILKHIVDENRHGCPICPDDDVIRCPLDFTDCLRLAPDRSLQCDSGSDRNHELLRPWLKPDDQLVRSGIGEAPVAVNLSHQRQHPRRRAWPQLWMATIDDW